MSDKEIYENTINELEEIIKQLRKENQDLKEEIKYYKLRIYELNEDIKYLQER